MAYKNIMEEMVEQQYEKIKSSLGCCDCAQCRDDVLAYALNQLPAHYVVTQVGGKVSEAIQTMQQNSTDIRVAICKAADLVSAHPRH